MKHNVLSFVTIAVLAMSISCSKENVARQQEEYKNNGPFEVTITGEMGEFAPTAKSTAEACVRMKWAEGDIVWAYDKDGGALGGLTVSIEESDYIATMTGTLSSEPSEGKLFLVHSPLLSKDTQPSYSSGLTADMKEQAANVTPFVAYAVVEGVTATEQSKLKTKFSFATSVLKVNATGISKGAELASASISGIETVCRLTINEGAFEVTGETSGTITKTLSGTASLSRASFCVGVPAFSAGAQKVLTVTAGGKGYIEHKVMQSAYEANNYINYVYEVKTLDYTDEYGESRGDGTYIASTGVVWAPVNCGYEPTNYKYGKLYQWGRKYGCGYNDGGTYKETLIQQKAGSQGTVSLKNEDPSIFYIVSGNGDWCETNYYNLWDSSISASCTESGHIPSKTQRDPCPEGWRVPAHAELTALLGSATGSRTIIGGTHGITEGILGLYFDGTDASDPSSGIFLPVAGYRVNSNGNATSRRSIGSYWCSSAYNDSYGRRMFFNSTSASMSSHSRAFGFSVRCVQE